jgi:hypothetical protein
MERILIAERRLEFSEKGEAERKPLIIRVFAPQSVDPNSDFELTPTLQAASLNSIPMQTWTQFTAQIQFRRCNSQSISSRF